MSASTVSITANPTVSSTSSAVDLSLKPSTRRRRVVVVAENKPTAELVVDGGIAGVSSDKIAVRGKDLSCTSRGQTVIERPQELYHPKNGLVAASTVSTRHKKSTLRLEESMGQTVFSIVIEICFLLTVVFWLGWIIWEYGDQLFGSTRSPFSVADFEGRISGVEASLKVTEKMMQVELGNLDMKLAGEVGSVRRELMEQIEENGAFFEKELEKLERKSASFVKSLADMRDESSFTQEELWKLLNDVKSGRSSEENGKNWSLDEIRVHAREVVVREIEKHAADGLGRVDYALASGGARVVGHSEPYDLGKGSSWFPITKGQNRVHANAHKMLEPSFGEPGHCFPLHGSTGFVEIKLRTAIILDSVTLEHVRKSVAYDRSSAPRECRISAWFEAPSDNPLTLVERMLTVMEFTYELEKSNAQTFNMETADVGVVNMIRLDFSSNHGSLSHTCIYRLRVHGYDPKSFGAMAVQA